MKREDVIRWAREAGLHLPYWADDEDPEKDPPRWTMVSPLPLLLERFAAAAYAAGAAAEREALKSKYIVNCGAWRVQQDQALAAIDEALAEQPAQPCGYPYCGCNSKAWCKAEQQSGIKQVIELYDSPKQPAQQDYWQEEARRYAQNAEFWRGKYEAATAQQQEPVAWIEHGSDEVPSIVVWERGSSGHYTPLYTSSRPSKPWVGLTEQEHTDIAIQCGCMSADWVFYGATVERILKGKNS